MSAVWVLTDVFSMSSLEAFLVEEYDVVVACERGSLTTVSVGETGETGLETEAESAEGDAAKAGSEESVGGEDEFRGEDVT